ncbi:MAG: YiiD C-terminal domain-containing protein [Pseudobdellovibrionaceae bacterium]
MTLAADLGKLLNDEIPISKTMGIRDFQLSKTQFSFELPLQPNINHKGTLFGGSLYSAGALACYGLFLSGLRDQSIATKNIVIAEGGMKYLAPVDANAKVEATWNSDQERIQFFKTLQSKKKARVLMRAQVLVGQQICAEFSGFFVAHITG